MCYRGFLFTTFEWEILRNALCNYPYDLYFPLNRFNFDPSSIASARLNNFGVFQCA